MRIVVISSPYARKDEFEILQRLFHSGLDVFHLRKPDFSIEQTRECLDRIPGKFHNRIILHHHHQLLSTYSLKGLHYTEARRLKEFKQIEQQPGTHFSTSFHHIDDIKKQGHIFDYVFLSPVFDSISKKGYKAAFAFERLSAFLKSTQINIMALGGVNEGKIKTIKQLGFYGAALLGAVWQDKHPVDAYLKIKKAAETA